MEGAKLKQSIRTRRTKSMKQVRDQNHKLEKAVITPRLPYVSVPLGPKAIACLLHGVALPNKTRRAR
jgi:hypothetical protein